MKKNLLLSSIAIAVSLTVAGCANLDSAVKQKELGQNTTGTLLQGMGNGVGLADAQAVTMVLDYLNKSRSWKSVYGSEITVTPSTAYYNKTNKHWCRNALISVNNAHNQMEVCKSEKGNWVRSNQIKKG